MGTGKWDDKEWASYSTTNSHATKTTKEIFSSTMKGSLDPKNVMRESCDSDDNPESTPVIVGLDVTGSMNGVSDKIVRESLNKLIVDIHDRKPVTDPHILMAGIGDVEAGDRSPLQVTQFEADIKLADQLTDIWLENGGGGNSYESYALLWWFAANHTKCDSFKKRQRKGFLFTMGDEWPTPYLRAEDIERVFGTGPGEKVSMDQILTQASREWEIFHLQITEGWHGEAPMERNNHLPGWNDVLGQRALKVTDYHKIPEVIVSTMQIVNGENADAVVDSWDGSTSVVVREATKNLTKSGTRGGVATL
jgi:hypothetical protein